MNNSDNNDRLERDMQSIQEKTSTYIFSNLLSVLSATSLLVGSIIFLLYFFDIQYFPDLNFNDSILFLFVAAITGIYILLYLAILFMSQYFFRWYLPLKQQNHIDLINDEENLSDKENFSDNERIWYFFSMCVFWLAFVFLPRFENTGVISGCIWLVLIVIIFFVHYKVYWKGVWVRKASHNKKKLVTKKAGKCIRMLLAWLISAMMILPIIIYSNEHTPFKFLGILLVVFFGILSFAWFYEKQKQPRLLLWAIPFLTLFFISLLTKNTFIPNFVMEKYKFGNFEVQQLLVDAKGCKILKHLELIPDNAKNKTTCHMNNIKILSRLGRSFYLETTPLCKPQPPWLCNPINFTIPSDHILSWSVTPPKSRLSTP